MLRIIFQKVVKKKRLWEEWGDPWKNNTVPAWEVMVKYKTFHKCLHLLMREFVYFTNSPWYHIFWVLSDLQIKWRNISSILNIMEKM